MSDNALIEKIKPTVAASPHEHSKATSVALMRGVIIALVPAFAASVFLFGPRVLLIEAISILSSVLFEYLSRKLMKRDNTIGDLSAIVTGLLLAFNVPSTLPLWMVPIGTFVAIVVVKQFFGGIGQNFVNPALMGRIVLMVSFPNEMTSWVRNYDWKSQVDAVSSATPLAMVKGIFVTGSGEYTLSNLPSFLDMLLGKHAGCLGETCAAALILGGLYLIFKKVISPLIPLTFIGTVALCMALKSGDANYVVYNLLGGGLLLGAIFMATDYATCPLTFKGKIIYGIGCGFITSLIRIFGNYAEGVSFSIILMNLLVPHIDNLTRLKPFGFVKPEKDKKGEKEAAAE